MKRFPLMLLPLLLLGAAAPAVAEKADVYKQTTIDCTECQFDGVSGKARMAGKVVITRGTLKIEADRGEAERAPDGYQSAVVEADPGKMVRFRQKSDGPGEQWMEGEARRVEYDERSAMLKLLSEARVWRVVNGKQGDEIRGDIIAYNSRTEMFDIRPAASGAGRGTIILQPRRTPPVQPLAGTGAQ
jgi:lipopolysaccharide export system protein LptA